MKRNVPISRRQSGCILDGESRGCSSELVLMAPSIRRFRSQNASGQQSTRELGHLDDGVCVRVCVARPLHRLLKLF